MINKLSYFLKLANVSRRVFAEKLGVSKSYIDLICQQKRRPSLNLALKMGDLLDRDVETIFFALPPNI